MAKRHSGQGERSPEEEESFQVGFATCLGHIAMQRVKLKARLRTLEIQLLGRSGTKTLDSMAKIQSHRALNDAMAGAIKKSCSKRLFDQYINLKALAEEAGLRAKLLLNGYWIRLDLNRLALAPDQWLRNRIRHTAVLDSPPLSSPISPSEINSFPSYTLDDLNDLWKVMQLITKELDELYLEVREAHDFVYNLQGPSKKNSIR
jgi:hypothetical protein